jgi:hypothetical protein
MDGRKVARLTKQEPAEAEAPKKRGRQKMPKKEAAKLAAKPRDFRSKTHIEVEEKTGRVLSQRQKKFAELFVEGIYTNRRAAILAGYSVLGAHVTSSHLLDPRKFPQVTAYIAELQEERSKLFGVTLSGQLKRLAELSRGAEGAGQYSAAINAEKLRSVLGGLTVDRRETINKIDQMTKDEILGRLSELQRKFPQAFTVIEGQYDAVVDAKALVHRQADA